MIKIKSLLAILSGFAMIFFLSGCFLLPEEEQVLAPALKQPPQITYETIEMKKGLFEKKTRCTGYFVSVSQKDMSFTKRSGRIKDIYAKTGQEVKKGDLLAELFTDNLESQVKQQEIIVEKCRMGYELAVNSDESKFNIRNKELDLELEQLRLDDLKTQLAETKLVSTIDGTVDYILDVADGEYVDLYRTIVRVANPRDLQIQYSEDKVSDFELGAVVDIEINDAKLKGTVVMTPSNMPKDADEKTRKSIRIKTDSLPEDAGIGDSTSLTLTLIHKENVIVIPKNLVHTMGLKRYVHVLENNIKKERDIEIGAENNTEVEVVKGLAEGDKLIKD